MNITNLLSVEVLTALAGLATGIGASGVVSWMLNRYDRRHPVVDVDKLVERIEELNAQVDLSTLAGKLEGLNTAVKELAYLRIRERHENAMRHGWLHPNEKHVLERLYAAYHSIGGNGTGTQMIEDIRRLPSIPPGGDTTSRMSDDTVEPPENY
ncbi:hypothetical protein [Bifidobacterium castoris]|uniref:Uncharacterized protein n=1 Tax=Bifidobacterium castoris TaxID=2306972 RepID=A0A430F7Q0_9BIFI|nr:hypothetical protein [Bifidobacterium castoris]RSX48949.1 hypothetical protein D2E22_1087 [Bifidobacterium castoris]